MSSLSQYTVSGESWGEGGRRIKEGRGIVAEHNFPRFWGEMSREQGKGILSRHLVIRCGRSTGQSMSHD